MAFLKKKRYSKPRASSRLSFIKPYLPGIASGIALAMSFPYIDLYPLAWFCLVPFFTSLWDATPARAFKTGYIMGIPYFFGTLYWVYHSMYHFGSVSLPVSLLIALMLALYLSLYTGLFALLFSRKLSSGNLPSSFLAPVIWTTLEFIRSYALTGFPWSSVGYSQYKFLHIIQIADITGIYGVSFLVIAINGALADIVISGRRRAKMPLFEFSYTYFGYLVLFVALATTFIYGNHRLNQVRPGKDIKVSIAQGSINQDQKWDEKYKNYVISAYKELTYGALKHQPDLVVWPETSVPFIYGSNKQYTYELEQFQRSTGAALLLGAITQKDSGSYANSAVLLSGTGELKLSYDKIHLVPFGEYVPMRKVLFFVDKLAVGIGDYISGREYKKGSISKGDFAPLICYEVIFPGLVRKFFTNGGDFIVNITNDAWFGTTSGPYQHFGFTVFRAIENRKPLVRAANTGISGFVDSSGRIISKTSLFERTSSTETMRTDSTLTFYTKYGDLFSYLCMVAATVLFVYWRRR